METIPMHDPGQAKQCQSRQKPGKNQAGVAHPINVQLNHSHILESQTIHLIDMYMIETNIAYCVGCEPVSLEHQTTHHPATE